MASSWLSAAFLPTPSFYHNTWESYPEVDDHFYTLGSSDLYSYGMDTASIASTSLSGMDTASMASSSIYGTDSDASITSSPSLSPLDLDFTETIDRKLQASIEYLQEIRHAYTAPSAQTQFTIAAHADPFGCASPLYASEASNSTCSTTSASGLKHSCCDSIPSGPIYVDPSEILPCPIKSPIATEDDDSISTDGSMAATDFDDDMSTDEEVQDETEVITIETGSTLYKAPLISEDVPDNDSGDSSPSGHLRVSPTEDKDSLPYEPELEAVTEETARAASIAHEQTVNDDKDQRIASAPYLSQLSDSADVDDEDDDIFKSDDSDDSDYVPEPKAKPAPVKGRRKRRANDDDDDIFESDDSEDDDYAPQQEVKQAPPKLPKNRSVKLLLTKIQPKVSALKATHNIDKELPEPTSRRLRRSPSLSDVPLAPTLNKKRSCTAATENDEKYNPSTAKRRKETRNDRPSTKRGKESRDYKPSTSKHNKENRDCHPSPAKCGKKSEPRKHDPFQQVIDECARSGNYQAFRSAIQELHWVKNASGRYMCPLKGCNLNFERKYNGLKHFETHYDVRDYSCELCGRTFTRSYDLKRHRRAHHGLDKNTSVKPTKSAAKAKRENTVPAKSSKKRSRSAVDDTTETSRRKKNR